MWIKICGITRVEDARLAADAGADAVGVNMVAGPRRVGPADATQILSGIPPGVCPVVLARVSDDRLDPDAEQVIAACGVSWVQLYGDVTASAIASQLESNRRPIVVVRVGDEHFAQSFDHLLRACGQHAPSAVLLDARHGGHLGGTGQPFPWHWVTQARRCGQLQNWPPILLAGGLTSENVTEAVRIVQPWGVDVSSGVESAPGRKDLARLAAFVRIARAAHRERSPLSPEGNG